MRSAPQTGIFPSAGLALRQMAFRAVLRGCSLWLWFYTAFQEKTLVGLSGGKKQEKIFSF